MSGRKSYNQLHAEYVARVRQATPDLAALAQDMDAGLEREREAYAREAAAPPDEEEDATDLG